MKRRTISILEVLIAIISILLIATIANHFFSNRIVRLIVDVLMLILYAVISGNTARARTKQLIKMWQLADQLGYRPVDLKEIEPRYGVIDWQLFRPEKLQFYPSNKVVKDLVNRFDTELSKQRI